MRQMTLPEQFAAWLKTRMAQMEQAWHTKGSAHVSHVRRHAERAFEGLKSLGQQD